jgi:dienelactone hydrolase
VTRATTAGHRADLIVEAAGHAFFNDSRDTYQPDAVAHAWTELLPFLTATLQEAS